MVFLSETKMSKVKAQDLRFRLGFQNAFGVDSVGLSGGLVLYWRSDVVVDLKSHSRSHIDVWVSHEGLSCQAWRFMGFYGHQVALLDKLHEAMARRHPMQPRVVHFGLEQNFNEIAISLYNYGCC
ncbi:hypothetical protein EJB05_41365, partial [Eragrostis curvula]